MKTKFERKNKKIRNRLLLLFIAIFILLFMTMLVLFVSKYRENIQMQEKIEEIQRTSEQLYTDNTIDGDWSLTTWRENNGEVYRTSPAMVQFAPGQKYEVVFDYKVDANGVYKIVGKRHSSGEETFSYELNRPGKCHVCFTTPNCEDFYLAIEKNGNGMLVIDNFGIKKIE